MAVKTACTVLSLHHSFLLILFKSALPQWLLFYVGFWAWGGVVGEGLFIGRYFFKS